MSNINAKVKLLHHVIIGPIYNLPFLSKALEKTVAAQLQDHLIQSNLFEIFQSGFRPGHSTETALVRVTNDLLMAADTGSPSPVILLDLTATFDTVDHNILLHRLQYTVGLTGNAHNWFTSYLTGRTEHVALGKAKSHTHSVPGLGVGPHPFLHLHASPGQCHQQAWVILPLLC